MICCAADEIMMGAHSSLGPIDPQIFIQNTAQGPKFVPSQAIIDQFELAAKESTDKNKLSAWLPILSQYGPHLVVTCQNLIQLSTELARDWLQKYMFKKETKARQKAEEIFRWLSDHNEFKSHARHISRSTLENKGMRIIRLEDNQDIQDKVLGAFHATTHSFDMTPTVKIIENHLGKAFIKIIKNNPQGLPTPPAKPKKRKIAK